MMLLILIAAALAGATDRLARIADRDGLEEAIRFGTEWLDEHPEHAERAAVQHELARLSFSRAEQLNTPEEWARFREQFPAHSLAERALARESTLAWRMIEPQPDLAAVEDFLARYPGTPFEEPAARLRVALSFEAAQTPEQLRAVLARFPDAPQAPAAAARLVEQTLQIEGCGDPCGALSALQVTWTPPPGHPVELSLSGLRGGAAASLEEAYRAWAGAHAAELSELLAQQQAEGGDGWWRFSAPFALKRVGDLDGVVVQIEVGGQQISRPIPLQEVLPPLELSVGVIYPTDSALLYAPTPGAEVVALPARGGIDYSELVQVAGTVYAHGDSGLVAVDLQARTQEVLLAEPIQRSHANGACVLLQGTQWWRADLRLGTVSPAQLPQDGVSDRLIAPDCSQVAVFDKNDKKNVRLRIYNLSSGALELDKKIDVRAVMGVRDVFEVGAYWRAEGLFVDIYEPEVVLGSIVVDRRSGAVRRHTPPAAPAAAAAPAGVALPITVREVGGVAEVFVGGEQITNIAEVEGVPPFEECYLLKPAARRVVAESMPGMPLVHVYATLSMCNDPYVGAEIGHGAAWLFTPDGSRSIELPYGSKLNPARWSWSPDGRHIALGNRIVRDDLVEIPPPEGAGAIIWVPQGLQSVLQ